MQRKDYFAAMKFYEAALEDDTTAAQAWFEYAECARHFNANTASEKGYLKVLQKDPAQFPQARLLGEVRSDTAWASIPWQRAILRLPFANPAPGKKEWEAFAQKMIEECDRAEPSAQFVSKGLNRSAQPLTAQIP
jgi:hypothetical protein